MSPYSQTYSKGRRNSGGRGRGRKSPSWYDKKYSARTLAVKALQNVNYIRGLVNSEKFHFDTSLIINVNGTTGNVNCLSLIPQGDGESARTGRSLLVKDLYIRLRANIDPAVTLSSRFLMVVFQDTQQVSDTVPSFTDIFNSPTPEAMMNLSTAGRFKVMYRKTFILTPATGGRPTLEISKYFKLFTHLKFNGTAGTDIQKNAIYIAFVSSETGLTNPVTISGQSRIGYHDN